MELGVGDSDVSDFGALWVFGNFGTFVFGAESLGFQELRNPAVQKFCGVLETSEGVNSGDFASSTRFRSSRNFGTFDVGAPPRCERIRIFETSRVFVFRENFGTPPS